MSEKFEMDPEGLRHWLFRHRLNHTTASVVLGVSRQTVSAWFNGRNRITGPAIRLMKLIDESPELVDRFMGDQAKKKKAA